MWSSTVAAAVNQGNTTVWHNDQYLIRVYTLTQLASRPSGYTTDGVTAFVKIPGTGSSNPPTIECPVTHRGLSFVSCNNVYIKGIKFEGFARDPGPGNAWALFFQNSMDVTIDQCEFTKCYIGGQLDQNCSRFLMKDSYMHDGLDHSGFHGLKANTRNVYQYESLSTWFSSNTENLKQLEVKNCRWEETPNGSQLFNYIGGESTGDQMAWAFWNTVHEQQIDGFEIDGPIMNVVVHDCTIHGSQALSIAPAQSGVFWMFNNQINWGWRANEDIIGFSEGDPRVSKEAIHLTFQLSAGPPPVFEEIGTVVCINNTFVASTQQRNGNGLTGQSGGTTGYYFLVPMYPTSLPVLHFEFQNNICTMSTPSTTGPPEGAFWWNGGQSFDWANSRFYRNNNTYYVDGAANLGVYWRGSTFESAAAFRSYVISQGQDPDIFEKNAIEGLDPLLNAIQLPSRTDPVSPVDGFPFVVNGATLAYDTA
jgi:hypothetical protein